MGPWGSLTPPEVETLRKCVASNGLQPGAQPLEPWETETWGGPGIGLFMASEQGRGWAPGVLALAPRPSVGALGLWAEQGAGWWPL